MDVFLRLRRAAYQSLIWVLNALVLRLPGNWLRVAVIRLMGAHIGAKTRIERGVKLDFPWRLRIGFGSTINTGVYLDCRGSSIHIGNNVDISRDAIIYTLTHDIYGREFAVRSGSVKLLDRAWVCSRVIVLPGTLIGTGSVVGANSVASGCIPSHQLWQGNPALFRKDLPHERGSVRSVF